MPLPDGLEHFSTKKLEPTEKDKQEKYFTSLQAIRVKDAKLRYRGRIIAGTFFAVLLYVQNITVFQLILIAYSQDKLGDLWQVFSIIAPATLAETAAIVHTMVKWIFQDTDYAQK